MVAAVSVSAACMLLFAGIGVLGRLPPSSSCRAPACSSSADAAPAWRPRCVRPLPLPLRPKWRRTANQLAPMRRRKVSRRGAGLPPPSTSASVLLVLASALHTGQTGRRLPSPVASQDGRRVLGSLLLASHATQQPVPDCSWPALPPASSMPPSLPPALTLADAGLVVAVRAGQHQQLVP